MGASASHPVGHRNVSARTRRTDGVEIGDKISQRPAMNGYQAGRVSLWFQRRWSRRRRQRSQCLQQVEDVVGVRVVLAEATGEPLLSVVGHDLDAVDDRLVLIA
jgi:hypothetical protein